MKYGMNLLLWTAELSDEIIPVLVKLKEMGYDGVEVPLFNYDLDYASWGQRLRDLELGCTAVTVRTAEDNPISEDAAVRELSIEQNKKAVVCCAELGAKHLVGPFHSALGVFSDSGPTHIEMKRAVDSLRPVAEYAGEVGVTLALEPLCRFECYLANTIAQMSTIVQAINHPSCGILYDTFHAHMEAKSVSRAFADGGNRINHIHISESDRSTPGSGQVRWQETFDALIAHDYNGWLTVEAFGRSMPEIAAATRIWRDMFDSEEQLARDALGLMRAEVHRCTRGAAPAESSSPGG